MTAIEIAPDLAEGAVFLALRSGRDDRTAEYDAERELVYGHPAGARGRLFRELHLRWFDLLGLGVPLRDALTLFPRVEGGIAVLLVRRAARKRDIGSELYRSAAVAGAERRSRLVLGLTSERAADPALLYPLAARELCFADDMIDPGFAYSPDLPAALADDPARAELVRDRLAMLWEARVRGRLERLGAGRAPEPSPPPLFLRAFAGATDDAPDLYRRTVDGSLSSWEELIACALEGSARLVPGRGLR